jgi:alkanesulfonate monooxygenase SsuD/methylene tetrahydromethanopterin reductase-like flavin-dependent oxidoreductase (luciferase family)
MRFGVHLPVIGFDEGHDFTLDALTAVARAAVANGYRTVAVNDHLLFGAPWLDGPTALAAVVHATGDLALATTVALPVVRGPVALAKTAAALDVLSGGRMVLGIGPGSSPRDYEAVGVVFDERWPRFDEAARALRGLLRADAPPLAGRWYDTTGIELAPRPPRPDGPPLWIGSWGSPAGLRRVARLADGWLASAYNTTPERFTAGRRLLDDTLPAHGRQPGSVPAVLATGFLCLTDTVTAGERVLREVVAPTVRREVSELRGRLPVGTPEQVAELVAAYAAAGLDELLVWPVVDAVAQIEAFAAEVVPLADRAARSVRPSRGVVGHGSR